MLVVYLTYTAMYVHHSMSSHRNLSSFNSSASFSLNGLKYALNCFLVEDDNDRFENHYHVALFVHGRIVLTIEFY